MTVNRYVYGVHVIFIWLSGRGPSFPTCLYYALYMYIRSVHVAFHFFPLSIFLAECQAVERKDHVKTNTIIVSNIYSLTLQGSQKMDRRSF